MAERKLKVWVAAGLIDAATAQRIRTWEAQHSRPVAIWALVGLAALSIGLGVISVVAANWAALDGETRLALHAALMVGLGGALWSLLGQPGEAARRWAETGLFVFALMGLGFLGHLGQVYQTSAPTWTAIALWLALFAPLLLAGGQGWLCAGLLIAGCLALPWMRFGDPALGLWHGSRGPAMVRAAAECTAPVLLAPMAAWAARGGGRALFWRLLEELALTYAIAAVSMLILLGTWATGNGDAQGDARTAHIACALILGLAGAALWRLRPGAGGEARGAALGILALSVLAADQLSGHELAMGLLFITLWCGLGAAALHARYRAAFQIAVAAVALRLIILALEEAGGLLTSGVGLILGGVVTLAIAWAAMRLSKLLAPDRGTR